MINNNDREILIQYRLDQAEQTIGEVSKLIEMDLLNVAVNRIYYGIFYSLSALALKFEFSSSKHHTKGTVLFPTERFPCLRK